MESEGYIFFEVTLKRFLSQIDQLSMVTLSRRFYFSVGWLKFLQSPQRQNLFLPSLSLCPHSAIWLLLYTAVFLVFVLSSWYLASLSIVVLTSYFGWSWFSAAVEMNSSVFWTTWPLKMGRVGSPETSVSNHPTPRHNSEGGSIQVIIVFICNESIHVFTHISTCIWSCGHSSYWTRNTFP